MARFKTVARRTMFAAIAWLAAAACGNALAQSSGAETSTPVWTEAPVKIDRQHQTYQRIDPVPAPSAGSKYGPPATADDFPLRFTSKVHFKIIDSISFAEGGKTYRLGDLEPVDSTRICLSDTGARWACGLRARAALGGLLAGRPIVCAQHGTDDDVLIVECRRGGRDMGELLATAGHAVGADGASRYIEAIKAASDGKKGVWGDVARTQ